MLCISITPTSRKFAKVDLLNASKRCDLIELCLDHLVKEPDVGDLLSAVGKPVLVSCRRAADGGHWQGSEEDRLQLLRQAIVAGPAYVELELDIAPSIPRFGETKRVVSYTRLDKPLGNVDAVFDAAWKAKADVVKFTWPTPTLDAAWPLLAAVTKKRVLGGVGAGFGAASLSFSLLGRKYGSPWIYAALEHGMEAHEGQPTVWDLDELYGWREIDARTRFIGIVGFGPTETATVRTFHAGFQALGLNARCLPLALGRFEKLGQMLDILKINALVVSPRLASQLVEFAEQRDDAARESESADLLLKQRDGWHGYSTLWRAAVHALERELGTRSPGERPLERRNVLVVGSNGTSQALAWALQKRHGIVSLAAPDEKAARPLAEKLGVRFVPFSSLYDTLADVVVLADPSIAAGYGRSELNPSYLRPGMTVLNVCRLPDETEFVGEARERGAQVVEPSGVFAEYVASRFKSVTGRDLPPEAVQANEQ
jgi:3-dehydroquinate dehydratase / shikimate dehydrogenase